MADNEFQSTVESLFQGMNQFVSSKTVVGDPIYLGDTIILPLVDVSFAVGAGAASGSSKNSNKEKLDYMIIEADIPRLRRDMFRDFAAKNILIKGNVKSTDGLTKILDMVPDFVNRFTGNDKAEGAADEIDVDAVEIE